MKTTEFEELVAQFKSATPIVNGFNSEAVQLRVIDALIAASQVAVPSAPRVDAAPGQGTQENQAHNGAKRRKPRTSTKSTDTEADRTPAKRRQPKGIGQMVNDIELEPDGKEPFPAFINQVQPKNHYENSLATVYWFQQIAGRTPITEDMIYTVYRLSDWTLPADMSNILSKTGGRERGWIDQTARQNLQLTVVGINYVERTMRKRPPKAEPLL